MTVGLLFICTDKYSLFWKDFYLSAEKYLFPGVEKKYFVFTDQDSIFGEGENPNVIKTPIEHVKWPYNTLLRFEIFYKNRELYAGCDYLLFYNANTIFLDSIAPEELLPTEKEEYLVALCNKDVLPPVSPDEYTYDRNRKSTAYIPFGEGESYYRGCFNGGRAPEFMQLIETCRKNTNIDLESDTIALWHDESHLNRYLLGRNIKVVGTMYGRPEEWSVPESPKIIYIAKSWVFGAEYVNDFKKGNHEIIHPRTLRLKIKKFVNEKLFRKK